MLPAEQIADHGPTDGKVVSTAAKNREQEQPERATKISGNIAPAATNKISAVIRGLFALSASQPGLTSMPYRKGINTQQ
jgi:hypothetical protein